MSAHAEKRKRALSRGWESGSYSAWKRAKGCSSKIGYDDEWEAIHAALELSVKHGPCRYYLCDECGRWHLTSQCEELVWDCCA